METYNRYRGGVCILTDERQEYCFQIEKRDFYTRPVYIGGNAKYLNKIQVFVRDEDL